MQTFILNLKKLKKLGAIAVKQSLEDEGASFEDIKKMRTITLAANLDLNVKIGGCEAKNDVFFCKKIGVNGIVAPMVESKYALKKFIQVVPKEYLGNLFINLESKTAFNNINKIISHTIIDSLEVMTSRHCHIICSRNSLVCIFNINHLNFNLSS